MRGSKCRCGFATVSARRVCPRCGKHMDPGEWQDEGKVLSFTKLQAVPEGSQDPHNMALVVVEKGPKVVCWTSEYLAEGDEVSISEVDGRLFCTSKSER